MFKFGIRACRVVGGGGDGVGLGDGVYLHLKL